MSARTEVVAGEFRSLFLSWFVQIESPHRDVRWPALTSLLRRLIQDATALNIVPFGT